MLPSEAKLYRGAGTVKNSIWKFRDYLVRERPDVIFSARPYINVFNYLMVTFARSSAKIIFSYRTSHSQELSYRTFKQKLILKLDCLLSSKVHALIGVSDGVSRDIEFVCRKASGSITTVYNPAWSNELAQKAKADVTWMFKSDQKVICSVGRLDVQKNVHVLIDAFGNVLRQESNCRLLIIGDGPLRKNLEDYVKKCGLNSEVVFLGYVLNPLPYISKSDVFVLSSNWEGFGNVLVEALGVGCPVVSTDCPSGPSEILENGKYGRLVPMGDSAELAEAILQTIHEESDVSKLKARAQIFSVENCADKFLGLIK